MPDLVVRHVVQTYAYYVDFCVGRKGAVRLATGADNLGTPVLQVVVKHGQRHLGLASAGTEDQRLKYLRRAGNSVATVHSLAQSSFGVHRHQHESAQASGLDLREIGAH